ncbi:hypothetical protein TPA0905_58720 [Streptomyces olivaceus]|nr:hypothetical protein TPA0905_58720 [Streptomyces olivaceus]
MFGALRRHTWSAWAQGEGADIGRMPYREHRRPTASAGGTGLSPRASGPPGAVAGALVADEPGARGRDLARVTGQGHRPDQERRTPPDFLLSEALTRPRAPLTFNASYSVRHI